MGLKENVIIGKLIPAGTGMEQYRKVEVECDEDHQFKYEEVEEEREDVADADGMAKIFSDDSVNEDDEADIEVEGDESSDSDLLAGFMAALAGNDDEDFDEDFDDADLADEE